MALFNFTIKDKPDLKKIEENLATIFGNKMVTMPQHGPVIPGQELGSITAKQQGTGMPLDELRALAGLATSKAPQIAAAGGGAINKLMAQKFPEIGGGEDPTGQMKNFRFLQTLKKTNPREAAEFEKYIMRPNTILDMGQKYISAADAQKMRNSENQMPPIGITFDEARTQGYNWVDPAAITKGREQEEKLGSVEQAFNTYKTMANKFGAMSPVTRFTDPDKYRKFSGAYAALQLEIKELANLGVLAGPDMDLIERVIQDPTSIESNAVQYFSGENPLVGQLDLVEEKINAAKQRAVKLYGVKWKQKARQKVVNFEDL